MAAMSTVIEKSGYVDWYVNIAPAYCHDEIFVDEVAAGLQINRGSIFT